MITRTDIEGALRDAGIEFWEVEHPPALTTEQADAYIEGHEGVRTKSLFLVNRKRTQSYLLVMDDAKDLDLKEFAALIGESRLSFGSGDRLREALDLEPGVVSPFGMLDPQHRELKLMFDNEMLRDPILTFHPSDNTATIFLATGDLLKLLEQHGVEFTTLDV